MRLFRISTKCLCILSIIASFGTMFSTSVFAQSNGSKPLEAINYAQDLVNYVADYDVCSSKYISNSTDLSDCSLYISEIHSVIAAWWPKLEAGTLTVSYDIDMEDELYGLEGSLKTVLNNAGYTYDASRRPLSAGSQSTAYQVSSDEIEPDLSNRATCALCGTSAAAGYYVCVTTIEVPVVALICGIGVATGYIVCGYDACTQPTQPPKACG
jgi:hypothetical protein